MKTQRNMKRRRSLFSLIVLSLVVGITGGLAWSSTSGQAATVQVATVDSTLNIPVSGTVIEPDGTILTVSGYETVNSTRVTDADGTSPRVVLSFDFSHVMASDGLTATGAFKTGGFQDIKIRPLQASDVIPITCPYYLNKTGVSAADTWLVTTTLNFDVTTGVLTSGSTTVGTNPYLSFAIFFL